jgi:hypothetical protein
MLHLPVLHQDQQQRLCRAVSAPLQPHCAALPCCATDALRGDVPWRRPAGPCRGKVPRCREATPRNTTAAWRRGAAPQQVLGRFGTRTDCTVQSLRGFVSCPGSASRRRAVVPPLGAMPRQCARVSRSDDTAPRMLQEHDDRSHPPSADCSNTVSPGTVAAVHYAPSLASRPQTLHSLPPPFPIPAPSQHPPGLRTVDVEASQHPPGPPHTRPL